MWLSKNTDKTTITIYLEFTFTVAGRLYSANKYYQTVKLIPWRPSKTIINCIKQLKADSYLLWEWCSQTIKVICLIPNMTEHWYGKALCDFHSSVYSLLLSSNYFHFFFFLNTFSKYAFNLGLVKWLNIVAGMLPGCMLPKYDIWYPNCDKMENR